MESSRLQAAPPPLEERAETSRFQLDYDAWHAHIAGTASPNAREREASVQSQQDAATTRPERLTTVGRRAA